MPEYQGLKSRDQVCANNCVLIYIGKENCLKRILLLMCWNVCGYL